MSERVYVLIEPSATVFLPPLASEPQAHSAGFRRREQASSGLAGYGSPS